MNSLSACPVCGSRKITPFLRRDGVPANQNVLMPNPESARAIPRGSLDLVVCEDCGFIFNRSYDDRIVRYGESYDNTQDCSSVFQEYLAGLAHQLIWERNVRESRVVEVGCGKGGFLERLVRAEGARNVGYGFDPSYGGPLVQLEGRLRFERRYYDAASAEIEADAVICRHVIEHVPDPNTLLRAIRLALVRSSRPRIFLETPCAEWILRHRVVWDFFYEHCSYFTAQSLATTVELTGFRVDSVRHVFGGQYLWLEASLASESVRSPKDALSMPALAKDFAAAEGEMRIALGHWIRDCVERKERVAIWGAGAKGVTLANMVDPACQWITCVVDVNPRKQGRYLPGTGHPIVGYRELPRLGVTAAVLMNPNYRGEVLSLLQAVGIDLQVIDLMN